MCFLPVFGVFTLLGARLIKFFAGALKPRLAPFRQGFAAFPQGDGSLQIGCTRFQLPHHVLKFGARLLVAERINRRTQRLGIKTNVFGQVLSLSGGVLIKSGRV